MANRNIVAIGASLGGLEALRFIVRRLPRDLRASVVVTMHLSPDFRSSLDLILSEEGALPACFATDGEPYAEGHIYLAPPQRHLIVDEHRLHLGAGPRENSSRPAIDPMLRSLGVCCGGRAIGIILTGTLGDGASGLWCLKQCGGQTVVQDPSDAAYPQMPLAAIDRAKPDHVTALEDIPDLLKSLVAEPAGETRSASADLKLEVQIAKDGNLSMGELDRIGRRSTLACPECHGVLWEIEDDDKVRFRCHVGHAYTSELMSLALEESLRRALASALRTLDERTALARKLHEEAGPGGSLSRTWARRAEELETEAKIIRDSIRRIDEISARAAASPTELD